MPNLNRTLKINPDVVLTEVGTGEAVLLHLGTKMYFSLNETGVFIWRMIDSGHTLEEISKKLQEEYDITPEKAGESVIALMDELAKEKLIEVVGE
jgi:hypothetical protein